MKTSQAKSAKNSGQSSVVQIKPVSSLDHADMQMRYWNDQMDVFLNELIKLRCLSGLLSGQQNGKPSIDLSELPCLIDPSIERLKDIYDELSDLFHSEQIAFVDPDSEILEKENNKG
jgi:hypothetical protein